MADPIAAIVNAATTEPDATALTVMRLSLVDWMACGLAGVSEPVSEKLRAMVAFEQAAGQATMFGGAKSSQRNAALVNGATSHALDYDDTHFAHIGHPSVVSVPAALAMLEAEADATVGQLVRTSLAGCEASIRMGVLLGRSHYQVGYHQTATAGAFGATLAAVLATTPDPTVHRHALGLVSTRASGLKSQFGTDGKPFNAGMAASDAVEAALLAGSGFVSNPDAWNGENGFLATHHADGAVPEANGFLMSDVSHKFHACCHGLHATLEALQALNPVDVAAVTRIRIFTHPRWMTVCNQAAPTTGLGAKFSYSTVTALSLLGHDTAALDTYSDRLAQDAQVQEVRHKVEVIAEPQLSETEARIELTTDTGSLSAQHDLAIPIPLDVRATKLRAKAVALVGSQRAQDIWDVVHGADDMPLKALTALMS